MAKHGVVPGDFDVLADFRESAGLTLPPQTLSKPESRLVDLLDEFLRMLHLGWEIPSGGRKDRFVPMVFPFSDDDSRIIQYIGDLGFTGDARRVREAIERYRATVKWFQCRCWPEHGDDQGWKEFQQRYVEPLGYEAMQLSAAIYEVRQLIVDTGAETTEATSKTRTPKKTKRSTERGEGQAKLIAALTKHHKYANGSCLNLEPVGNNELARFAEVWGSTASEFFTTEFGGHTKYRNVYCADAAMLVAALRKLNGEYSVDNLFGGKPPDEGNRGDDD